MNRYYGREAASERKGLRKGFTLMEVIFVVVIIAIIAGFTIPKIIDNSTRTEIAQGLNSDLKSIVSAVSEWKKSSSASTGDFSNLTTAKMAAYLPSTMKLIDPNGTPDNGDEYIESSAFGGDVHFEVISDNNANDGDSFKLFIDMSQAAGNNKWATETITYAEDKATSIIFKIAGSGNNADISKDATALGGANADFTTDGSDTDGQCGVRHLGL